MVNKITFFGFRGGDRPNRPSYGSAPVFRWFPQWRTVVFLARRSLMIQQTTQGGHFHLVCAVDVQFTLFATQAFGRLWLWRHNHTFNVCCETAV